MQIADNLHLSYCTNIHAGESWVDCFEQLKIYLPEIKRRVSPHKPFGIGLRLSNQSANDLLANEKFYLKEFHKWLISNDLYVFTLNGFPYGGFHREVVKDAVHQPDWTTEARKIYTQNLFEILASLLPSHITGGISTSPLSYKPWFKNKPELQSQVLMTATQNILEVVAQLIDIQQNTGKIMHLDIEPEPDGLLENSGDFFTYYQKHLLPQGIDFLCQKYGFDSLEAEKRLKTHVQLCYDICHFAVAYENHHEVLAKLQNQNIAIGKFQISSALRADLSNWSNNPLIFNDLQKFNESTYLHQVIAQKPDKQLVQYNDLHWALTQQDQIEFSEWRIHFHVPLFMEKYGHLESTQSDVKTVLNYLKSAHYTQHLEVETYTWDVLPEDLQTDLASSIEREIKQVLAWLEV
ncbi:MAG: metabolite traffic protein EboE [Microscillaceae bacterium]|jgi:hypothetical protein|nr:metabolite traffic protein EboE [Microscillaceae bacterium]